jgi:hypothetical protein
VRRFFPGICGAESEEDAAHADPDDGADLEQLEADRIHLRLGPLCAFQAQPAQRFHQRVGQRVEAQLAERKTEPNSGLGHAISYLLRHWQPLRLFLRKAGTTLDNNVAEKGVEARGFRSKERAVLSHRHGAQVSSEP